MRSSVSFDFAAKYFASMKVGMIPNVSPQNILPENITNRNAIINKIIKTNRMVHVQIYFGGKLSRELVAWVNIEIHLNVPMRERMKEILTNRSIIWFIYVCYIHQWNFDLILTILT